MTREMAVLGVPTISIYQSELLDVDRYLLGVGALIHRPQLTADEALRHMEITGKVTPQTELLDKGRRAYTAVKEAILAT